ncbi:MAG: AcrR family transcriptional regulator [Patiriisocius sp.]|jgi:AcrR family transcriptional regulator
MPKPLISAETIYEKALVLLDKDGPSGLSVRKLAAALRCSPATLYQQVGKREDMVSKLLAFYFHELDLSFKQRENWQESAFEWASTLHRALLTNPNLSRLLTPDNRHVVVGYVNQLLRVLLADDFEIDLALRSCRVLTHQVISLALTEIDTPPTALRRKRRSAKEIEFEDLAIAAHPLAANGEFQGLPEVFESAIKFTLLGIELTHQAGHSLPVTSK